MAGHCVCDIEGITINVDSGGGDPGPEPSWPDAPGWPPDTFDEWPIPPGQGGPPPPDPENACDPSGFIDGCTFPVELKCPEGVTRGSTGTCTLSVGSGSTIDEVLGWTFKGGNLGLVSTAVNSTTWGGTLIESGGVKVYFQAE